MGSFEELLQERGGLRVRTTTRILPPRQKVSGPRDGRHLDSVARKAGDCWYHNALPLAKFIYSKIEERFAEVLTRDLTLTQRENALKRKAVLLNEAKVILNEHRNQIFEAVLPMFDVIERHGKSVLADGEELPQPDQHAHDYFVSNVFYKMAETFKAWLPEFVHKDQLEASEQTLGRLAVTNSDRLQSELRNFQFGFRRIVAPRP